MAMEGVFGRFMGWWNSLVLFTRTLITRPGSSKLNSALQDLPEIVTRNKKGFD